MVLSTFRQYLAAIGIFEQLGYKKLHNSMFNGIENIRFRNCAKKRIAFNDIWSAIEFLKVFHQSSFEVTKEFFELNVKANELRNKSLGEVNRIIETIRLCLDGELISKNLGLYFRSIEEIILALKGNDNYTNPKITNDFYVHPILELNRGNTAVLKEFWNLINPIELNSALLECESRYLNQKILIDTYSSNFIELNNSFLANYKKVKAGYKVLFKKQLSVWLK